MCRLFQDIGWISTATQLCEFQAAGPGWGRLGVMVGPAEPPDSFRDVHI